MRGVKTALFVCPVCGGETVDGCSTDSRLAPSRSRWITSQVCQSCSIVFRIPTIELTLARALLYLGIDLGTLRQPTPGRRGRGWRARKVHEPAQVEFTIRPALARRVEISHEPALCNDHVALSQQSLPQPHPFLLEINSRSLGVHLCMRLEEGTLLKSVIASLGRAKQEVLALLGGRGRL